MPISSQALYFHLGLHADDDGVVEAYTVLNSVGCSEDDLKVLVSKGFVQVLNEDLVTYITDWNENNFIRADRKVDSIYQDLLISMNPSAKIIEKKQRADVKKKVVDETMDNQWATNGQPTDNQWTTNGQPMDGIGKDRIGKDRIGKDREEEMTDVISSTRTEKKHTYGEYKHVKLKDSERQKLIDEYGQDMSDACITFLDEYCEMTGKKYKSHYLAIRRWVVDAVKEKRAKTNKVADKLSQSYEMMSEWAKES
jgi:hypothetical protein